MISKLLWWSAAGTAGTPAPVGLSTLEERATLMGAFTTFSSYIFETLRLAESGRIAFAIINLVAQNALGLAALGTGIFVGRQS